MADKPRHLLAGYAAEILTRDERRDLMEAALADQDVFDRLVEEESWRRVLNAPGVRRELIEALKDRPALRGLFDWFRQPTARWALGGVAAAFLAVVLLPLWNTGVTSSPDGEELVAKSVSSRSLTSKELTSNELTSKVPVTGVRELSYALELWTPEDVLPVRSDYDFRAGDEFRIRLEADFPVWVYLFNQAEGEDTYTVVYPLTAGEHTPREGTIAVPPGDQEWLGMDDTPEDERLVLVVGTASWPGFQPGRESVSREELETALVGAEQKLSAKSWRRYAENERVYLKIADPNGELFFVERLFVD